MSVLETLLAFGRAMLSSFFGRDRDELERWLAGQREAPAFVDLPFDGVVQKLRAERHAIIGTPDDVAEQIAAYDAAGVDELMLQWFDLDDMDGLRAFAKAVGLG